MLKYLAFRYLNKEYHMPLQQALDFVVEKHTIGFLAELPSDQLKYLILHGMVSFQLLRDVAYNTKAINPAKLHREFNLNLKVFKIDKLTELDEAFDGYALNTFTKSVFYHGG